MKKRFGFVMIMAAMVVAAYDDVQVVYRGQLKANGQAPAAQTMPMTFRLYAKKNSGTASWTTNGVVAIDDKGLFQVALRGEGLAEAIDSGKANWIGISIAGGKEHYPRQALLAASHADKAVTAGCLADSPSVGTGSVERVEADSLAVTGSLSVGGNVKMATPATSSSAVGMDARLTAGWHTLQMKGKVRFFNGGAPIDLGTKTASGGGCSFGTADFNCVALFTSESSDIMPGMSRFVKKGESVMIPLATNIPDGTVVRCRLYQIGVE